MRVYVPQRAVVLATVAAVGHVRLPLPAQEQIPVVAREVAQLAPTAMQMIGKH
ncbi:MAG: hypothetical protein ABIG95_06755 [Candidatus Woesearchaeota archaeon]